MPASPSFVPPRIVCFAHAREGKQNVITAKRLFSPPKKRPQPIYTGDKGNGAQYFAGGERGKRIGGDQSKSRKKTEGGRCEHSRPPSAHTFCEGKRGINVYSESFKASPSCIKVYSISPPLWPLPAPPPLALSPRTITQAIATDSADRNSDDDPAEGRKEEVGKESLFSLTRMSDIEWKEK